MKRLYARRWYCLRPSLVIAAAVWSLLNSTAQAGAKEEQSQKPVETIKGQKAMSPYGELKTFKFGTVYSSAIWDLKKWVGGIPVCWENPSSENAQFRTMVQGAVAATWEKVSPVRFVDWNTCSQNARGIRIVFSDEGPHVKALGRYLDNMPNGMVLNTRFENWSPSCKDKREFCLKAIAVHEFGHALGFAHEQNRPDAPPECRAERQGTDGDWNVTSYDPDSIMNYCNIRWNNSGQLSKRDIEAVQTIYRANQ